MLRLDRIIAEACNVSRAEARALIKRGCVSVDGAAARSGEQKYGAQAQIYVNGVLAEYKRQSYIMMNKPAGYITSTEDPRDKTVVDLLGPAYERRGLFPAGRLDKDAEGLLILTSDGEYAHRVMSPASNVVKTYFIKTATRMTEDDVRAFESGVVLKDGRICRPAKLELMQEQRAAVVKISEGKYHQVKRMVAAMGSRVEYLQRTAVGGLALDTALLPGEYRAMAREEAMLVFKK